MAANGKSKSLTREQVKKLKTTVYTQDNMSRFLNGHGLVLSQIQYPINNARCGEKLYNKLKRAGLI